MKKGLKKILPGTGAVLLVLAGGVMAGAAGKEQEYIFPEVDKELLTEEDVKDLPAELLAYGRYEILAKHGELFESEELKEYFGNQKWYFGFLSDEKEVEGLLSDIEKENLAFLEKKEKAEGGYELDQKDFDYEIVKKWLEGTYVAGEETTRKTSEKKTKETEAAKTAETEAPATEALATEPATETPATEAPETEPVTEALAPEPATEAPTESVTETPETEEHVTDGKFEDLSDVDLFSLSQDELATTVREEPETEAESETESETETESEIEADTRSECPIRNWELSVSLRLTEAKSPLSRMAASSCRERKSSTSHWTNKGIFIIRRNAVKDRNETVFHGVCFFGKIIYRMISFMIPTPRASAPVWQAMLKGRGSFSIL